MMWNDLSNMGVFWLVEEQTDFLIQGLFDRLKYFDSPGKRGQCGEEFKKWFFEDKGYEGFD